MKILYIGMKNDYGDPKRGLSFERLNFFDSLVSMENGRHEVIEFAFDERLNAVGKDAMNQELVEVVNGTKPDLCFFFLFTDEIYPETIKKVGETGVVTYNWFADDHWRFSNFSKYYAPLFHWVSTTDSLAPKKYSRIDFSNVIKTQWACNPHLYKPSKNEGDLSYKHESSFVGQPHSNRRTLVKALKDSGISVDCYGNGWKNGRISHEEMVEIFYTSKVNLNFSKSSAHLKNIAKIFLHKKGGKISVAHPRRWKENLDSFLGQQREQIKGRNFEIPGSQGFLITGRADNIEEYFVDGREVVIYENASDLVEKLMYYVSHDKEREEIKKAGYMRTITEHTYEKRFQEIFTTMKLPGYTV